MLRVRAILIVVMFASLVTPYASGEEVLAEVELRVVPVELRIVPSEITMRVGTSKRVEAVFCDRQAAPSPGMLVTAVLRGSSLPDSLVLTTVPGRTFTIPALSAPGTYVLEDIQLEMNGVTLVRAVPDRVTIHVTSAKTLHGAAGTVDGTKGPER
ncbi:MAG: hypothetical protein HYX75_02950 [Acidobacteria bacterium]|nr:hypothetical protein [Acidobacteriota bacterium]